MMLANLESGLGFRSSFNFVGKGYPVSKILRRRLVARGFEVGLHGLVHDHQLYESEDSFRQQAVQINRILKAWGAVGFRSPCMYHNLDWLRQLDMEYDSSTFDTDPFEPQPDGVGTIFPFHVPGNGCGQGYMELPYTLPQDFTLFVLLKEKTIDIWKRKLDWIAAQGGMALLNVHPDYMSLNGTRPACDEYPVAFYEELLEYVASRYRGAYWHVLPRDVSSFCYGRLVKRTISAADQVSCESSMNKAVVQWT
ncbi:hypothetical protein [Geotalea sp. SG265]|uniref:hypothetical protein n=1 Tax=Geotalea sp. SG265 TaxID=2922867 RepID=UPI001FAF684B|nr:hypothetical protein [Geotalea sp. SG265]